MVARSLDGRPGNHGFIVISHLCGKAHTSKKSPNSPRATRCECEKYYTSSSRRMSSLFHCSKPRRSPFFSEISTPFPGAFQINRWPTKTRTISEGRSLCSPPRFVCWGRNNPSLHVTRLIFTSRTFLIEAYLTDSLSIFFRWVCVLRRGLAWHTTHAPASLWATRKVGIPAHYLYVAVACGTCFSLKNKKNNWFIVKIVYKTTFEFTIPLFFVN